MQGECDNAIHPKFTMASLFWDDENVLVYLVPMRTALNSDCCVEALRSLNARLLCVHPTGKMSDMLLLHDNTRLPTSLHITEAISKFGWTVLFLPLYRPDLSQLDYHLPGE